LLSLVFLLAHHSVFAQSGVLINEFVVNSSPQQVEVFNTASQEADISNWFIDDSGGKTYFTIPQETIIYPQSCLAFSANFYFNQQSADTIRLFDNTAPPTSPSANLVDSFHYSKNPGKNISFFRRPDGGENWATGEATIGSLNSLKINCIVTPTPVPTVIVKSSPTPPPTIPATNTPTPTPPTYTHIYLSEAMVNPKVGENEWVELYNDNNYLVNLASWFLDDEKDGGSSPKKFSLSIPAKNYATINLDSSIFNNDADSVRLLNHNKTEVDSFNYQGTLQGFSWGRENFSTKEYCLQNPSKNRPNNSCHQVIPTSTVVKDKRGIITKTNPKHKQTIKLPPHGKKGEVLGVETKKFASPSSSKDLPRLNFIHSLSFYAFINSGLVALHLFTHKLLSII